MPGTGFPGQLFGVGVAIAALATFLLDRNSPGMGGNWQTPADDLATPAPA